MVSTVALSDLEAVGAQSVIRWQMSFQELQDQFDRTPGLHNGVLASGEHYILVALLNSFGYHPRSRAEAIELAQELLAHGYDPT